MVKICKRIISLFLAVVTCISLCATSVFAAWYNDLAYSYTQSNLAQFGVHSVVSLAMDAGGAIAGNVVIPGYGAVAGTAISQYFSTYVNDGIDAFMADLAADSSFVSEGDFIFSVDNDYGTTSFSNDGGFVYRLHHDYSTILKGSKSYVCPHASSYSGGDSSFSDCSDPCFMSVGFDSGYGTLRISSYWRVSIPCNGSYRVVASNYSYQYSSVSSDPVISIVQPSSSLISILSSYIQLSYQVMVKSSCSYLEGLFYSPSVVFYPSSGDLVDLSDSGLSPSTRPSSFMQTINNYNSSDNSTNYAIGTVDTGGSVTNVYNVNIYDEETEVFTEPVTGAQYQTTGWIYDYNTRTYELSLESGTFLIGDADIDRIRLTYGDDVLNISFFSDDSLITTDTYVYLIATESSECQHSYSSSVVQEPTCSAPGQRQYTCSICGAFYLEDIPRVDHTYTSEITIDPTCIDPGERKYTCSVCGNQYTEPIDALGHDWQPSEVTQTTYELPPGTSCPDCDSTDFTAVLSKGTETFDCACSDCGKEWVVSAEVTYGQTTYTCTRCGETKVEKEDEDSGLFEAIGNFIASGIDWVTDKLSELIRSISGINDIFSGFIESIKEKAGDYPAFLGAAINCLPEDLMTVVWFFVVVLVVLYVWKKWFH